MDVFNSGEGMGYFQLPSASFSSSWLLGCVVAYWFSSFWVVTESVIEYWRIYLLTSEYLHQFVQNFMSSFFFSFSFLIICNFHSRKISWLDRKSTLQIAAKALDRLSSLKIKLLKLSNNFATAWASTLQSLLTQQNKHPKYWVFV